MVDPRFKTHSVFNKLHVAIINQDKGSHLSHYVKVSKRKSYLQVRYSLKTISNVVEWLLDNWGSPMIWMLKQEGKIFGSESRVVCSCLQVSLASDTLKIHFSVRACKSCFQVKLL